ncbi:MAG: hypothetical protein HUU29_11565, partial [Planctomycetaceae bacterium]|nr:hypothetical protein [Planctomycetaceae bacterium]
MKIVTFLSLGMAALLFNACALFSTVEFGYVPQDLPGPGELLDEVVKKMGAPDVIG